jgi:hypothetical protein
VKVSPLLLVDVHIFRGSLLASMLQRSYFEYLIVAFAWLTSLCTALSEKERLEEYHKRNYTFPIEKFIPDTPGWRKLMSERLEQVSELETSNERYEGFFQTMHSASLAPNFTEYGFGLAKCPDDLLRALQQGIHDGLPTAGLEAEGAAINGPNQPWYISRPDLTNRVLNEMQSFTEAWVGFPLTAHVAYGFRVYRNESQLYMHTDRLMTHVVSFILHIGSSDDAEPWPIFIEDFHGRTHEVTLTPGDILFYESSKCFHGRPRPFNGSWYTSVFVHYYPKLNWIDEPHDMEAHYAIPPQYATDPPKETREIRMKQRNRLEMVETTMREPNCPNDWCRSVEDTVKWGGPAEHGVLITPGMERIPFFPKDNNARDEL